MAQVRGVPVIAEILAAATPSDVTALGDTVGVEITALDRYGVPVPATIQAGNAYANVHTTEFPPGEIRGQVD